MERWEARRRWLVRGACVVTAGRGGRIFSRGEIRIVGDEIRYVGPETTIPADGWSLIDASGMIAMPGLVDDHRHLWQTPLRGLGADLTAPGYRSELRGKFGPHYTPEDLYAATLAGAVEALAGGVTAIGDFAHIVNGPAFADAAVAALKRAGIRAVFGYGTPTDASADAWYSCSGLGHPEDIRRVGRDLATGPDTLVGVMMAARAPYLMDPDTLAHDWRLARELGMRIHVDGGLGGGIWGGTRHYPLRTLAEAGLLGADTTYVHCNNLSPDEYRSIADSGGHVSISPSAEMNVGHGMPAILPLLEVGVRPSLSGDFVTQTNGDMFEVMRLALTAARGQQGRDAFLEGRSIDSWALRGQDMLDFATVQGAASLGLAGKVGRLEPGMKADLILLDARGLRLAPVNDPLATIVMQANASDVDTVMVGGTLVKRGGRMIGHDLASLRDELSACRDRLFERAGVAMGHRFAEREAQVWAW